LPLGRVPLALFAVYGPYMPDFILLGYETIATFPALGLAKECPAVLRARLIHPISVVFSFSVIGVVGSENQLLTVNACAVCLSFIHLFTSL